MDNTLNARFQHAVIGQGTTINSVPKIGEVVFNSGLTNFKVGNGYTAYNYLPFLLGSSRVYYTEVDDSYSALGNSLANYIMDILTENDLLGSNYNHLIINDPFNYLIPEQQDSNVGVYSIINYPTGMLTNYLQNYPGISLKITYMTRSVSNLVSKLGIVVYGANNIWMSRFHAGNTIDYSYTEFHSYPIDPSETSQFFGFVKSATNNIHYGNYYWYADSITITYIIAEDTTGRFILT